MVLTSAKMDARIPPSPAIKALSPLRAVRAVRTARGEGAQARQRLLLSALKLFASNGFSKTSIREIAHAAGVNVAAISYYFGDKAELYRTVFVEPMGSHRADINVFCEPGINLKGALQGYYASFLAPLKQGELLQQCVRLHFREMIEPTGLWAEEIEHGIKPAHLALCTVVCRHLGLARPDEEVHRLAFAIAALALQMFVARDLIDAIAPRLVKTHAAIDKTVIRLADFALAMVGAEQLRRANMAANTDAASKAARHKGEK
jgi:TetR/AcrR family transcriptional regulator, regulator of cefoperazone and chloramphenicol sensitivity